MKTIFLGVGVAYVLVLLFYAAAGDSAPPQPAERRAVCIEEAAIARATECPEGAKVAEAKRGTAPVSAFKGVTRKEAQVDLSRFKQEPTEPWELSIEDRTRRRKQEKAVEDLLLKELHLANKLINSMASSDPKKPEAFFRVAELNFELQQNYYFKAMGLKDQISEAKEKGDKNKFLELKKKEKAYMAKSEEYRHAAIQAYAKLVQEFPDFERMDEVLFYLGFALDEIARTFPEKKDEYAAKAREIYKKLIKEHPGSKYIPNAYLSFAEFYFNEGDMGNALKFYREVSKYKDTNVYLFSIYKQAWCLYNMQDYKGTIEKFIEVIEEAAANPEDPNAASLMKQARLEMVMPYAQIGTPDRAWEFFTKYGGDLALKQMQALAENYFGQGRWKEAIATYHKLMEVSPNDPALCDWQYWVTFATNSLRHKPDQFNELKNLAKVYKYYSDGSHPEELKADCLKKTAGMILDQAIYWHREAVGTDTQPGTNDPNTMRLASETYDLIVREYPNLDEIPQEGDESQRITLYKIAYYKAELLWKMEDWVKCGPAFDEVVAMDPHGEYLQDAAYAAVLCYNNLYGMYHKDDRAQKYGVKDAYSKEGEGGGRKKAEGGKKKKKEKVSDELAAKIAEYEPKKISSTEEKMLNAFSRYTCYVKEGEELCKIKYRKARIFYEANHFEEAAYLFKDVAETCVNSDVGIYAANLYLDSLNAIRTWNDLMVEQENRKGEEGRDAVRIQRLTEKKLACGEALAAGVDNFLMTPKFKTYLETMAEGQKFGDLLYTVKCNIERLKAEDYHKNRQFKEAALTYYRLYKKWGPHCPNAKLDEVLYNMAIEFEAARLIGAAIKARQILITDPRYANSEWAKRALFFIGQNYHAIALYEKAAEYYEAYAKKYAGEKEAPEALQNATFFRLGLGHDEKAISNAMLFQRNYSSGKMKRPTEVAMVFFGIGTIFKKNKQWTKTADHYKTYLKKYKSPATMDFAIRASVEIGNAYWQIKNYKEAARWFKEANDMYAKDPMSKIQWAGDTPEAQEADKAVRGRLMFNAVAQARFHLGEIAYQKFKEIKLPEFRPDRMKTTDIEYSGDPQKAEAEKKAVKNRYLHASKRDWEKFVNWMKFQTWTKRSLGEWQKQKEAAMKEASAYFADTAKIGIEEWEIAASARHGDMFREIFQVLYDAPVADLIKEDPDLLDLYNAERDKIALPYKEEAIVGFRYCLEKSKEKRWFNEWSLLCERELNRLDPKTYPISAEMRTRATLSHKTIAEPKLVDKLLTDAEIKEKKIEVGAGLEEAKEEEVGEGTGASGAGGSEEKKEEEKEEGKGKEKGKGKR